MTKKSFAELVDYDAQFEALAARGIFFSDENKEKFKAICNEELGRFDGNSIVSTDLGASATGWVYALFSFIQNIFSGFDIHNIGDSFSGALDKTSAKTALHMLQESTIRIYERFKAEGGEFTRAAELVSGQKALTSTDRTAPIMMKNGIYDQIVSTLDRSYGPTTSLSHPQDAELPSGSNIPGGSVNTPLTRGLS